MLKKKTTLSIVSLFIATVVNAGPSSTATNKTSNIFSPFLGRALFSGTATNATIGIFSGDVMQPIYGNQKGFIFGDLMGDYGTDDTYQASPGLGFRQVFKNQMLGVYAFSDYERTSLGENFWVLSPGIELISPHWDAHLNGYFPTTQNKQIGPAVYANTLGDNSHVYLEPGTHNQYDLLVAPYDVIGKGMDAELGYSFAGPHDYRERLYVGTYYYQPSDNNINDVANILGITAGFEQPISKNMTLFIFNSYDQVSNYTVGVGLSMIFGGDSTVFSNNVQSRLLDPVQRHVGIIATGAGSYDQQGLQYAGEGVETVSLEYTNIYYVAPDGSSDADGTLGNPMNLSQTSLNTINAESPNSSRIYIQGGSSAIYEVNASTTNAEGSVNGLDSNNDKGLYVYNGQDFYGRTPNYTAPAASDAQPQIEVNGTDGYNGFIAQEGENTFSDLSITDYNLTSGDGSAGIIAYTTSDEKINVVNTTISGMGHFGMTATNASTGTLNVNTTNSSFDDNGDNAVFFSPAVGGLLAYNNDTGTLNVNAVNSSFDSNGTETTGDGWGFYVANLSTGTFNFTSNGSTFNGNGLDDGNGRGVGLRIANEGTAVINISNSQFNDNGVSTTGHTIFRGAGIYATNNASTMTFGATNSTFNGNGVTSGTASDGNTGGLMIFNSASTPNSVFVTSLSGTHFDGNQGYGIYGNANNSGTTIIDYTGASFAGTVQTNDTNSATATNIDWVN